MITRRLHLTRLLLATLLAGAAMFHALGAGTRAENPSTVLLSMATTFGGCGLMLYMFLRPSGDDPGFGISGGAFVTSSHSTRLWGFGLMLIHLNFVLRWLADDSGAKRLISVVCLVAVTMIGVLLWCDLPRLELRPEGIRQAGVAGRGLVIPWEALASGYPPRPAKRSQTLILAVARPDLMPRGMRVPFPRLQVGWDTHPQVVAAAIRWYVEHPEDRAAIGTQAGHDHLRDAIPVVVLPR